MSVEKSRDNSDLPNARVSQWEALMRKFSESHKEECKAISVEMPRVHRSTKQFPTGSQYEGTWDMLGMSGYGVYTFSNGVIYEGEFDDGMFHGEGELRYPSGAILRGKWKRGQLIQRTLIFADGLEYKETDWKYCRMPDRRDSKYVICFGSDTGHLANIVINAISNSNTHICFGSCFPFTIEYEEGLQPAGCSYLTAEQPTRPVPRGYYDTGDGFYDPKTKVVYRASDLTAIIRSPSAREQKWIIDNCRTSPDIALGPRKDLYEEWSKPEPEPKPPTSTSTIALLHGQSRDLMQNWTSSLTGWNNRQLLHFKDFF